MNPTDSESTNDDDHCCDTPLNFSASKLNVYQHERLAFTEPPSKRPKSKRVSQALKALLALFKRILRSIIF